MSLLTSSVDRKVGAARLLAAMVGVLILASQSASASQADDTSIILVSNVAGPTPFIRLLNYKITPISNLRNVQFIIQPKPGSVTRPISATYSTKYLTSRGYLDSNGNVKVPVFGLYDGFTNSVTLNYFFADGSAKQNIISIVTNSYSDPCNYNQRMNVVGRTRSTGLSYDFMLLKDSCGDFSPAMMDTDGALRWVGTQGVSNVPAAFVDNAIYLGTNGPQLLRIELDGTVSVVGDYSSLAVTDFHHNIDPGKYGLLVEVDTATDVESVILEVDKSGNVRKIWSMALIIERAMRAGGDDPSAFVRRGQDWFHNNSVTYRASDDSLVVSSRENFVIALDYRTSAIKWILGDTSKAWYQYASLRKYALKVPVGVAPIGQHALSITYNDKLLLFDDGFHSLNQTPPGNSRKFAAPRKYSLSLVHNTAAEIYSYNRPIVSEICSSVYEDAPDNYLVDYSVAGGFMSGNANAELVGLQSNGQRVFDYKYPTRFCDEIFNALPIHLEDLSF